MNSEWQLDFMDGTQERIKGYALRWSDGVLSIRTTHNGSYVEEWVRFPLANVKSWRKI